MFTAIARRAVPALGVAGLGTWAAVTTSNDAWDDVFPSSPKDAARREKIVVLGARRCGN